MNATTFDTLSETKRLVTKEDLRLIEENLRHEIELLRRDLTIRMGSMLVIAVGVIATLIKLL